MAKRNMTLLEFALYSHIHDTSKRQEIIDYHLRLARFLKATGGRSIVHLLAPGPELGDGEDDDYRNMDLKAASANINEVGKRVLEETGIRIGYHPEQGDIRAGIWERYLESTDDRYFKFWPDVGHMVAAGVDPLGVYKKHRARIIGTHFRDYQPPSASTPDGRPARGRMVPFGTGIIKLPELAAYLRETKFDGTVMGEGGGNEAMAAYMAQTLKLRL
jgi:inosose dehydratase